MHGGSSSYSGIILVLGPKSFFSESARIVALCVGGAMTPQDFKVELHTADLSLVSQT